MFCDCKCHDGAQIFCSCFVRCCHEPYTPREKQTAYSKTSPITVKFTRVVLPEFKKKEQAT